MQLRQDVRRDQDNASDTFSCLGTRHSRVEGYQRSSPDFWSSSEGLELGTDEFPDEVLASGMKGFS